MKRKTEKAWKVRVRGTRRNQEGGGEKKTKRVREREIKGGGEKHVIKIK